MATAVVSLWSIDSTYSGPLSGWIDPDGRFYPCRDFEHADVAYRLGKNTDKLLAAGWLHVGEDQGIYLNDRVYPTNSQHDTLEQIINHQHCPRAIKKAHEKMLSDPFREDSFWCYSYWDDH